MKSRIIFQTLLGIALYAFVGLFPHMVEAALLKFNPSSGSFSLNSTFQVKIDVDTLGVDTTSTDAVINYDNTYLSVDSVSYGSFYDTVLHSEATNKLSISGMVSSPGKVVNGAGTLATITFKVLTSGTTQASFTCTPGRTDDSNVSKNDINSSDIVDCNSLTIASYTLGTGTNPTVTPGAAATATPATSNPTAAITSTTTTTTTTTTTSIPQAGLLDILALMPKIMMGILLIIVGLIPLFT